MKKTCALLIGLVLVLGFAGVAAAKGAEGFEEIVRADEGWVQKSEGYWERTGEEGRVQTIAVGRAGLEVVLDNLRVQLVTLVGEYLANPDDEMHRVLDTHTRLIQAIESDLANKSFAPKALAAPLAWCNLDWDAAAGGRKTCTQYAKAYSLYEGSSAGDCFGLGDLYAYAYVRRELCNHTTLTQSASCDKDAVFNQECSVEETLSNVPVRSCYSYAYASIYCPDYSYFQSDTATSTSCGWLCLACPIIAEEEREVE